MGNERNGTFKLPGYEAWWGKVSGHLSGIYPYLDSENGQIASLSIQALLEDRRRTGMTVSVDPVGLATKTLFPYLLGNRTLVQGISRAPWMSRLGEDGRWAPEPLPPHGSERPQPEEFTEALKKALLEEVKAYIKSARTVGVLLSGGMDSRIVAGIVRLLQLENDSSFSVVGLTWGDDQSRDVVYAQRIAAQFGWEWLHYPITVETLARNIVEMGEMGAEVSPLHLHAMPDVARTEGIDVILAATYGDSIGRGEYSGRKLGQLKPVLRRINPFGIVRHKAVRSTLESMRKDAVDTPHIDAETGILRRREIEHQMNYLRRMLHGCMQTMAGGRKLFQVFTSPDVVRRMWALDPSLRDDRWYAYLLQTLPGSLLDLPWARTGRRYLNYSDKPDKYSRLYHSYSIWLRQDLRQQVFSAASDPKLMSLGVLNEEATERVLKEWLRDPTKKSNRLDEVFSWLPSLVRFLGLLDDNVDCFSSTRLDSWTAFVGGGVARLYVESAKRRERNH